MEKTIYIEGMKCDGCKRRVENALSKFKGLNADISVSDKKAVVVSKKEYSNEEMTKAIEALGFRVTAIE